MLVIYHIDMGYIVTLRMRAAARLGGHGSRARTADLGVPLRGAQQVLDARQRVGVGQGERQRAPQQQPRIKGLHSFTLELNLSNSRTHSRLSWVTWWPEEL